MIYNALDMVSFCYGLGIGLLVGMGLVAIQNFLTDRK